jgi:ATP-dependent Clp endopeptidase proteolytic subunit ClpP
MPIKINNQADGSLEIELYDVIGYWGTSAKSFRERIVAAKGKAISLRINSPGGNVIEGNAIYNLLKDHDGEITAHIDGMAASMASVIAMAADKIIIAQNALLMIHNVTATQEGDSEDMRKAADLMDKMKDGIVAAYAKKTGKTKAKIEKWMDEETWFSAQEAVDNGFADSIKKDSTAKNQVDVLAFAAYYPEKQFPASASAKAEPQPKQPTMTPEEIQNLQNQVKTLEAEKGNAAKALADAQAKATTDATNAAKSAEKARKDGILALQAKYNKDGDLNDAAVKALAGDVTPDAFKDQVLEIINARATRAAIKPSASAQGAKDESEDGDEEFEKFQKDYAAAALKGNTERREFVAKNKVLCQKYLNRISK